MANENDEALNYKVVAETNLALASSPMATHHQVVDDQRGMHATYACETSAWDRGGDILNRLIEDANFGEDFSDLNSLNSCLQNEEARYLNHPSTTCQCAETNKFCVDRTCTKYRKGEECDDSCTNSNCLNKCIQSKKYVNHTIKEKSRNGPMGVVSNQDIYAGQGIVPVFGTLTLVYDIERLQKRLKEQGKGQLDISYRHITEDVVVEYTKSGSSAKFIAHSCNPNAQTVIKILPSTQE